MLTCSSFLSLPYFSHTDFSVPWPRQVPNLQPLTDCCLYEESFIVVVQLLSCVQLFDTPWTEACQTSLSFTISWSMLKLVSIAPVMSSNHFMLWSPLLILLSFFPRTSVFSNESALCIRWPKYWSFSVSTSPSNEYSGLISFRKSGTRRA